MKKHLWGILFGLAAWLFFSPAAAEPFQFSLGAGDQAIDFQADSFFTLGQAEVDYGGGFRFHKDQYQLGRATIGVSNEVFGPGVSLGIGFKSVFGRIDSVPSDVNVAVLGFNGHLGYDLRPRINWPLGLGVDLFHAPEVLCAGDVQRFSEADVYLNWRVVQHGTFFVGYRFTKAWTENDDKKGNPDFGDFFCGVRLSF